ACRLFFRQSRGGGFAFHRLPSGPGSRRIKPSPASQVKTTLGGNWNSQARMSTDDYDRLGNRRLVCERDIEPSRHPRWGDLRKAPQGAPGQLHAGLSGGEVDNSQITPEHTVSEPRAERFCARLLGSEPASVARCAARAAITFAAFGRSKNAIEKAVAVALDHLFDPPDVDQIAADTEDHRIRLEALLRADDEIGSASRGGGNCLSLSQRTAGIHPSATPSRSNDGDGLPRCRRFVPGNNPPRLPPGKRLEERCGNFFTTPQ